MQINYNPAARHELIDAARYFEDQEGGLGRRFLTAFEVALTRVATKPEMWQADLQGRRKYRVKGFLYHIIYKLKGNALFVLDVAHASRRPGYWKQRDG